MATDFNKIIIMGRLTRDPEFKQVNNTPLVNFSIAVNKVYNKDGQKKEEVSFFDCQCWGKLADVIKQYCKKGKQILIEGELRQETWDAPDGKKMSKVKIVVQSFNFIGGQNQADQAPPEEPLMPIDDDECF